MLTSTSFAFLASSTPITAHLSYTVSCVEELNPINFRSLGNAVFTIRSTSSKIVTKTYCSFRSILYDDAPLLSVAGAHYLIYRFMRFPAFASLAMDGDHASHDEYTNAEDVLGKREAS